MQISRDTSLKIKLKCKSNADPIEGRLRIRFNTNTWLIKFLYTCRIIFKIGNF